MSELSERCYAAGWMMGLEYVLWDAVLNGERKYGQGYISNVDISKLKDLSSICQSWIYFDEKEEETAIDIISWNTVFSKELKENSEVIKRI